MSDLRALAEEALVTAHEFVETDDPYACDVCSRPGIDHGPYMDVEPATVLALLDRAERADRAEAALRDLLPYATSHKQVVDGGPLCDAPLLGDWIKCNCGQREARERARAALESAK